MLPLFRLLDDTGVLRGSREAGMEGVSTKEGRVGVAKGRETFSSGLTLAAEVGSKDESLVAPFLPLPAIKSNREAIVRMDTEYLVVHSSGLKYILFSNM